MVPYYAIWRGSFGLCAALATLSCAYANIRYTLTPEPNNRAVRVSIQFEATTDKPVVSIPAWCPGFYVLKSYERELYDLKASTNAEAPSAMRAINPRTWEVNAKKGDAVQVTYRVEGDDPGLGFFGVNVQENSAFVNGPAGFMFVEGRLTEPHFLDIKLPGGWSAATGMDKVGSNQFKSEGYDEFIDHPIELGKFKKVEFKVMGYPFEAVFTSTDGTYPDLEAAKKELQALSEPAIRMFGGAPFKKYTYIIHLDVGNFGGGLEHRASTVLAIPNTNPPDIGTLAAHEFFHVWNVKHIRPKALGPFDYTNRVRTKHLWFAEGVTDYYANMHAYEAGVLDEAWLLAILGDEVDTLQTSRSRNLITLENACLATWEHGGFGYGDMSYYNKGLLVGLILDAAIRDATNGAKSLDDVMRLMFLKYKLPNPGFGDEGILEAVNQVAIKDLSAIYKQCVQSTQELPYEVLQRIGLRVVRTGDETWVAGFDVRQGRVDFVAEDVRKMGIKEGDFILQWQGMISPSVPSTMESPEPYRVTVEREGTIHELTLVPVERKRVGYALQKMPNLDDRTQKLLNGWLRKPVADGIFNGIIGR